MTTTRPSSTFPASPRWRHPSVWRGSSWLVAVQVAVVSVMTVSSVLAQVSGRVGVSWWLLLLLPFGVAWWGERVVRRQDRITRAVGFGVDLDDLDGDGAGLAPYEVCDCAWCGGSVDGEPVEVTGCG